MNNIVIQDRKSMTLNGIEDVMSFDDTGIIMQTGMGTLSIDGTALHIMKLNLEGGEVIVEGTINGLFYIDENISAKQSGSKLKKFFK